MSWSYNPAPLLPCQHLEMSSIIYIDQVNFHLTFLLGFYTPERKTVKVEWIYILCIFFSSNQPMVQMAHGEASQDGGMVPSLKATAKKKLPSADNSKDQPGNSSMFRRTNSAKQFQQKITQGN